MSQAQPPGNPERLRLPARLESVAAFRDFALARAEAAGLDPLSVQKVELVLEEALVNVIHHAYHDREDEHGGPAELAARALGAGVLLLELSDWGPAFDPLHPGAQEDGTDLEQALAANLAAGLDEREPGGLGLFLIRSMCEASYRRENGANVLAMRFAAENAGP